MNRLTKGMLERKADYLNKILKTPAEAYRKEGDRYRANIGNHHISYAYGGACLHRMSNESGGVSSPVVEGHVPKRELINLMEAYIRGLLTQWDDGTDTHRGCRQCGGVR